MNDDKKAHLKKFLEKNMRFDGRKLDQFRPIAIEYGVSKNAEGSCKVVFGDTQLYAGVKLSVEKPYPDTPEQGNLMVGAELSPSSSPRFESGPPGAEAVELARVVDRGIRESKAIESTKLCITKGEKVWTTMVDVVTVNADGNLIDAASLAAIAALKEAKFPKYDGEKIDYKERTSQGLPMNKVPIAITVFKLGEYLLVDPTAEEEELMEARLTVTSFEGKLCAMQKGGDYPLTLEEIDKMISLAMLKSKELAKYL